MPSFSRAYKDLKYSALLPMNNIQKDCWRRRRVNPKADRNCRRSNWRTYGFSDNPSCIRQIRKLTRIPFEMPEMLTTPPVLTKYLGKRIDQICQFSLAKKHTENHCAHFVSHVMKYDGFAVTCKSFTSADKQLPGKGAAIRVDDIFNVAPKVGPWEQRPPGLVSCLIFVTNSGNMRRTGTRLEMKSHRNKHIGIFIDGTVWHYSNTADQVAKDSFVHFTASSNMPRSLPGKQSSSIAEDTSDDAPSPSADCPRSGRLRSNRADRSVGGRSRNDRPCETTERHISCANSARKPIVAAEGHGLCKQCFDRGQASPATRLGIGPGIRDRRPPSSKCAFR